MASLAKLGKPNWRAAESQYRWPGQPVVARSQTSLGACRLFAAALICAVGRPTLVSGLRALISPAVRADRRCEVLQESESFEHHPQSIARLRDERLVASPPVRVCADWRVVLRRTVVHAVIPVALALTFYACGGGDSSSSPSPSPTPTPPATPTTFTLRGHVSEGAPFNSNNIAGAKVEFTDGANAGKSAIADAAGNYVITNANGGGFTVKASADGFVADSVPVTLTANVTQNFELSPAGPRRKFGPGQYRVNTDIAPGRYYAVPSAGCYFERQKGLGGSTDDIIANEFIGFDAGQWIVDIKSSDVAFETDEDCGVWFNSPRAGKQSSITPGMWLVGSQISSGTYRASTSSGCYWARLRNFSNTTGGIIANDFVSGGGGKLVSIRSSDLGFQTDDDCGIWTKSSSAAATAAEQSPTEETQTTDDIERNRTQQRHQNGGIPK